MGWDGPIEIQQLHDGTWNSLGDIDIMDIVCNRRSLAVALGSDDVSDVERPLLPLSFSYLTSCGSTEWDSQDGYLDWNKFCEECGSDEDFPFHAPSDVIESARKSNPHLADVLTMARESNCPTRLFIEIAW